MKTQEELETSKSNMRDIGKFMHSLLQRVKDPDILDEMGDMFKKAHQVYTTLNDCFEVIPETASSKSKRRKVMNVPLPGDSMADDKLVPMDEYDLRVSDKNDTGYMYVHEITNAGSDDARFQAQPYVSGYGKNGRWHAGNWKDAKMAALAVSIATTHLISTDKVKVVMNKIHQRVMAQEQQQNPDPVPMPS